MKRGDVWWAELEQKRRPVLVLTRDPVAGRIDKVTVASITTRAHDLPTEVVLGPTDGMPKVCVVSLDNVRTVHRNLLEHPITSLSRRRMDEVCRALDYALGCS
ncbi:MAG: type II toxin-antitoxin system PemK/MazF family toxin [Actinomycetota bacterium]|nr:type II toxin-antitoxin system PemK/MazF family toxin [Actinomycetota bacterium]